MAKSIKGLSITDLFAKVSDLELKDMDGNASGLVLKVVGTDSSQYRAAEKKMFAYAGKKMGDLTPEEITTIAKIKQEIAISCIVGWHNDEAFGCAYSPEAALTLFSKDEAKFILDQVEEYAALRANFFRKGK